MSVIGPADGQRTGITRPNGVNSTYAYDIAGRLTSAVHAGQGGTLQSFTYALDAVGNRTSVTSLAGTENYTLDALNRLTNVTYPNGDAVGYAYDANGNRLTKTFNGTPTNYTYDNADQLTSDGTLTYAYDANGNMTAAGVDTFTWDYANRMSGATVGGTASTYAYDGDDTRVTKTVGGTPTSYLWDRESGLPMLVDDGTNAYLQEDGALAQVNGAGTPEYLLDDAPGSRRGVTNLAGTLTGTADYDTFGAVRASTGAGSVFGYTGEQFDAETGYTYLRARYLNPALGRFNSADTVQPNTPGTQGYNLYAYVANNPATWVDPSGHDVGNAMLTAYVMENPDFMNTLVIGVCAAAAGAAIAGATVPQGDTIVRTNPGVGLAFAVCMAVVTARVTVPVLVCAMTPGCLWDAWDFRGRMEELGSSVTETINWTLEELQKAVKEWPKVIVRVVTKTASIVIENVEDCDATRDRCMEEGWYYQPNWPGETILCFQCWSYCLIQLEWPDWNCPPSEEANSPSRLLNARMQTPRRSCGG